MISSEYVPHWEHAAFCKIAAFVRQRNWTSYRQNYNKCLGDLLLEIRELEHSDTKLRLQYKYHDLQFSIHIFCSCCVFIPFCSLFFFDRYLWWSVNITHQGVFTVFESLVATSYNDLYSHGVLTLSTFQVDCQFPILAWYSLSGTAVYGLAKMTTTGSAASISSRSFCFLSVKRNLVP